MPLKLENCLMEWLLINNNNNIIFYPKLTGCYIWHNLIFINPLIWAKLGRRRRKFKFNLKYIQSYKIRRNLVENIIKRFFAFFFLKKQYEKRGALLSDLHLLLPFKSCFHNCLHNSQLKIQLDQES